MANQEQLAILEQGVAAWNAWRKRDRIGGGLQAVAIDLIGADLEEANLSNANLSNADLSGADLYLAQFGSTAFGDTNLSAAKNLESCRHVDRSYIDLFTLIYSKALPE